MQVNPQEVSAEKATTPAADLRLVSVEQLQKIHRELDACQKVIWLAGCGPRGYGFDPSYVTGAQEQLKQIEALINTAAPVAQSEQVPAIPQQWAKSLSKCWPKHLDDQDGDWCVGTADEDGNLYEVLQVEASQYDAAGESQKIAEAIVSLWSFAAASAQGGV
ncbi:hypothetical protein AB2C92_07295 [Pseudomonas aeruginosa]